MDLDSLKASVLDCIPVVALRSYESELSYILVELLKMCLRESCFRDCWKVSLVVPVFKNVGESSTTKSYHPVSLLSVGSKVFEKLVNNKIVDHLKKWAFYLISVWFQVFSINYRSSDSVSDKVVMEFQVRYLALFSLFSVKTVSGGSGWEVLIKISS